MDYEIILKTKKYLKNSLIEMIHSITNSYIGDNERQTLLIRNTYNIFNITLALAFTLKNREKNYLPFDIIDTKNFLNECVDDEFISIFVELKPAYIKILDVWDKSSSAAHLSEFQRCLSLRTLELTGKIRDV